MTASFKHRALAAALAVSMSGSTAYAQTLGGANTTASDTAQAEKCDAPRERWPSSSHSPKSSTH